MSVQVAQSYRDWEAAEAEFEFRQRSYNSALCKHPLDHNLILEAKAKMDVARAAYARTVRAVI